MIESLHISGFKLFRDLTLPRLGRLNLFVGENNTGKSCLLEAIGLYAGRNPVTDVLDTASRRSTERLRPWGREGMDEESTSIRHPIFQLFHREGPSTVGTIIIERIGDPDPLRIEFGYHQLITDEQGVRRYVSASPGDEVAGQLGMALPVFKGDKQVGLIRRDMLDVPRRLPLAAEVFNKDVGTVAYLPPNGFTDQKAASIWDALVQGPGQDMVLDWLRILEPKLESLAYVGEGFQRNRAALLKLESHGRIPLRSMGDGVTKLFHVALAAASSSRGILLIDEFENGLHWRVQDKLWGVLSRISQKSGVQIFATTHSRDCIESFTKAAKALEAGEGMIYRLECVGGDIFAADLPLINVDAAMRVHAEVR